MNINQQATLDMIKANVTLYQKTCELLHRQSAQAIENLQKATHSCETEIGQDLKRSLESGNWNAAMMAWANMPLIVMKLSTQHAQEILESGIKTQLQTTNAYKDAIAAWQRNLSLALQEGAGAMPMSATLRNFFNGSVPSHEHTSHAKSEKSSPQRHSLSSHA